MIKSLAEKFHIPRFVGILFVGMAIVTTGSLAWLATEQQECNETFAREFAKVVKLENAEDDAEQRFWRVVFEHPNDRPANIRAFKEWIGTFERTNKLRTQIDLLGLAECE